MGGLKFLGGYSIMVSMSDYYLAIDIGASGGRHILGTFVDGRMELTEVHRFENGTKRLGNALCWDVDGLFGEIKAGMKKCALLGKIPRSVSIDTWGVDFVLLDKQGERISPAVSYRDGRTAGMDEAVYRHISAEQLYARSGIQKVIFNSIYQLMALKLNEPDTLYNASYFMMIPDYFQYLLSGRMATEYTIASTTGLLCPHKRDWDFELMEMLGYPPGIFGPITMPGTVLSELLPEVAQEIDYNCLVVSAASHDTASAVMAVPLGQKDGKSDSIYLSSGTWSLMGVELTNADCSAESERLNFTNEGGYGARVRYLKNIMGLWMLQSVRRELSDMGQAYSYDELCELAKPERPECLVDVQDSAYLSPKSMIGALKDAVGSQGGKPPETPGELTALIYHSLAACYARTARELSDRLSCRFDKLYVVGGGSRAAYLNQLTADATGLSVLAGETEATALGNVMAQMICAGRWATLDEARSEIFKSCDMRVFMPGGCV